MLEETIDRIVENPAKMQVGDPSCISQCDFE